MNAGIATDQGPVMNSQAMRVSRIGQKVDRLEHLTGSSIVLHKSRPVIGVAFAVVPNDLPDGACFIIGHLNGIIPMFIGKNQPETKPPLT